MSSPPDGGSGDDGKVKGKGNSRRELELRQLAPQLIGLEVWCLQRGLADIAHHLGVAVDLVDSELTQADGKI